jgi:hypothetical protein
VRPTIAARAAARGCARDAWTRAGTTPTAASPVGCATAVGGGPGCCSNWPPPHFTVCGSSRWSSSRPFSPWPVSDDSCPSSRWGPRRRSVLHPRRRSTASSWRRSETAGSPDPGPPRSPRGGHGRHRCCEHRRTQRRGRRHDRSPPSEQRTGRRGGGSHRPQSVGGGKGRSAVLVGPDRAPQRHAHSGPVRPSLPDPHRGVHRPRRADPPAHDRRSGRAPTSGRGRTVDVAHRPAQRPAGTVDRRRPTHAHRIAAPTRSRRGAQCATGAAPRGRRRPRHRTHLRWRRLVPSHGGTPRPAADTGPESHTVRHRRFHPEPAGPGATSGPGRARGGEPHRLPPASDDLRPKPAPDHAPRRRPGLPGRRTARRRGGLPQRDGPPHGGALARPLRRGNDTLRAWALDAGYLHVRWSSLGGASLDTLDWVEDEHSRLYRDADEIARRLLSFPRLEGGIALLHLSTTRTEAPWTRLPDLVRALRERGISPIQVTDMLEDSPTWAPWLERARANTTAPMETSDPPPAPSDPATRGTTPERPAGRLPRDRRSDPTPTT